MLAVANLVWMKPIGAAFFFIVALLVLRKDARYSLNQLFALSFLLFGATQIFDFLKDVLWSYGYPAIVLSRNISVVTGIVSTGLFLLVGIYVRYGAHQALRREILIINAILWIVLSVIAIFDQSISDTPDPVLLTRIYTGLFGMIALFIMTSVFVIASTIMLFSASRDLTDPKKRRSIQLLALGMLILVIGAIAYGLEGIFSSIFSPLDPILLYITLTGLIAWLIGAILCLLAFRHRF
ncbi:MAG: hypothetical protein ACFFCO_02380 [Promethearchaeota archaeon]